MHGDCHLLRVDPAGQVTALRTQNPVRSLFADTAALLVEVDVDPWRLSHLGGDSYKVVWPTRWLRLPWAAEAPDVLTVAEHGLDEGAGAEVARRAHDRAEVQIMQHLSDWAPGHDLGAGWVRAACVAGGRRVASVERFRSVLPRNGPVEVIAVGADRDDVRVLLTDEQVDVGDSYWALPRRPLDVDSYLEQVLRANTDCDPARQEVYPEPEDPNGRYPLVDGVSRSHTSISGDWPDTKLEWAFRLRQCPGVIVRRRVPLFDELGRIANPEYASIHLMEDLDTKTLPPVSAACDGVLDI